MMPKPGGVRRAETICHQHFSGGPWLPCDECVSRHCRTDGDIWDRFNTRRRCPQAVGAPVIEPWLATRGVNILSIGAPNDPESALDVSIWAGIIKLLRDREDRLKLYLLALRAGPKPLPGMGWLGVRL